jgi:hypothetical protein
VAAGHSVEADPARWQGELQELLGRVAGRFGRWRARALVRGLLSDLPRKNCWTIAEHAGDPNPDGMQHLLARAVWDHDKVATTATMRPSTWATHRRRWSSTKQET